MPTNPPVDTSTFQLGPTPWTGPLETEQDEQDAREDFEEESRKLEIMRREAEAYIKSWPWAPPIKEMLLAYGVSEIIALYLVRFEHSVEKWGDEEIWVVVGDMPPLYFVTDDAPTPAWAFDAYCELAEDWANAVISGSSLANVYPVDAPPTREYADAYLSRVRFIRKDIMPGIA